MNILIVKLSAIGDVVHTLPSLKELRNLYPNAHITWLVEEGAASLIQGHPLIDEVLVSRRKLWIKNFVKPKDFRRCFQEIKQFLKKLRSRKYDLVIDFQRLFKSGTMVFLSGGKIKLGYQSFQEMSSLFYNETIPEDMKKHAVDRYLDFLLYLGAKVGKPEFDIPVSNGEKEYINKILRNFHTEQNDLIISINPVAMWETKLWSESKFAVLCDKIIDEFNAKVIFTGNNKRKMIENIVSRMKNRAIDLSGRTSLKELACLYQISDLIITTDSGPMHIAAAMQSPVVALFGPTTPLRTGPYGEGHTIVRKDLPCSPCFKKKCDTLECMKKITVDDVFEAVSRQVGNNRIKSFSPSGKKSQVASFSR